MSDPSRYLNGQILIAMPAMADPRFHKAVIFVCAHDPQGAMGLMLTQTVPAMTFGLLLGQLGYIARENVPVAQSVVSGGPVETVRGFVLHTPDFNCKDTIIITPEFSVTGTIDGLKKIAEGTVPHRMIFALGYSGWGEGQLEKEIQDNAWLTTPATHKLIFDTAPEQMWDQAFVQMGINPLQLSTAASSGKAQ